MKNEKILWNNKLLGKLLLNVIVADLKCFILKDKLVIYTKTFIEPYNWKNHKQIYEIYMIIKFKKLNTLITKNPHNFGIHSMIKILLVIYNNHIISKNQDKIVFYVNNYIN